MTNISDLIESAMELLPGDPQQPNGRRELSFAKLALAISEALQKERLDERTRILKIVYEEETHYSNKEEMIRPAVVAAIFANAIRAKVV